MKRIGLTIGLAAAVVMIGRAHLANPHWSYQAALQLKEEKPSWVLPAPYAHWLEKYRPNV